MMVFFFRFSPEIRHPHCSYDAFRREHRLEREHVCIYMGACRSGRYGPDPRKRKRKRDMWHLGGVFYSFNVKTKIPPLSTFLYDIIAINQIRKTQNVSRYQRCLRVWGVEYSCGEHSTFLELYFSVLVRRMFWSINLSRSK